MNEPITDVNSSVIDYIKRHSVWMAVPVLIFAALASVIIVIAPAGTVPDEVVILIFLLFVTVMAPVTLIQAKIRDELLRQFAEANGYTFSPVGAPEMFDGGMFKLGTDPAVTDVITGKYLDYPITLCVLSFDAGKQISRYTTFMLEFDAEMPDMVIQPAIFSGVPLAMRLPGGPQYIKLEGDFNNYFSLNVAKGYEVDALEVFTPDIMQDLIDKCRNYSIEVVRKHFYIYDGQMINSKARLDALYAAARFFAEKLGPVLVRMKADNGQLSP